MLKNEPKINKAAFDNVYSRFPNFLFFTTVKTGVRICRCTACGEEFECGIHTLHRTYNTEWQIADSARHGEYISCPKCHKKVKVINTKLQKRLNEPKIEITEPIAFFNAINNNDVWVSCYFVNRTYSADGKYCFDDQHKVNVYHLTPGDAEFYKRPFGYFGWGDDLYPYDFEEPFVWNYGMTHRKYEYSFVYLSDLKLNDTFLKYSGYEDYLKKHTNAPMLTYWCWYCVHPQTEMLSKLGFYDIVLQMLENKTDMPRLIDWSASKPWDLFRLRKEEYRLWNGISDFQKIQTLKFYKALKVKDLNILKLCGRFVEITHGQKGEYLKIARKIRDSESVKDSINDYIRLSDFTYKGLYCVEELAKKIGRYNRSIKEAVSYFNMISRNSAGCCHHCVGITPKEAADMWVDYINMADKGKKKNKNFNPYPADLKTAHDNLLLANKIKIANLTANQIRLHEKALIKKLSEKYPLADKHCKALKKKYSYDNGTYVFVTPDSLADVLIDGKVLNQCTARPDANGEYWRYFDRINRKETYIGFVRKADTPDVPWFTIEFEPSGTVRQKRAEGDSQPKDTTPLVTEFLIEWQKAIAPRLCKSDKAQAKRSKIQRIKEFDELRKTGKKINYGVLEGTLLIDAFEKDLMEVEFETA